MLQKVGPWDIPNQFIFFLNNIFFYYLLIMIYIWPILYDIALFSMSKVNVKLLTLILIYVIYTISS